MSEKQSFVLYYDIREPLSLLNDSERGRLFSAILNYAEYGELPDFDGAAQMAFAFIRKALDRDAEKWESKREKRVEAGRLGGYQKAENRRKAEAEALANAIDAKQSWQNVANLAVPVPAPVPAPVPVPVPVPAPALYEVESKAARPPRARFVPPTREEVRAYCEERRSSVDPDAFFEYFEAGNWNDAKGQPVKSWKQKLLTWENKERSKEHGHERNTSDNPAQERKSFAIRYDIE